MARVQCLPVRCAAPCATCADPTRDQIDAYPAQPIVCTQCLSCPLQRVLVDGACVCVPGTYAKGALYACAPCAKSCATCVGAGEYNCTSCYDTALYEVVAGKCVCRSGTRYARSDTGACVLAVNFTTHVDRVQSTDVITVKFARDVDFTRLQWDTDVVVEI